MKRFLLFSTLILVIIQSVNAKNSDTVWTKFTYPQPINAVKFTPDGKYIVSAGNLGIPALWDAETGAKVREYEGNLSPVLSIDINNTGEYLAVVNSISVITIWDLQSGEVVKVIDQYENSDTKRFSGFSLEFSKNGKYLAAILMHGTNTEHKRDVFLWSTQDWNLISQLNNLNETLDLTFSPDNTKIAVSNILISENNYSVGIYEVPTLKPITVIDENNPYDINQVAFSSDGIYLTAAFSKSANRVWNTSDWSLFNDIVGNTTKIITFSPDSKYIVAGLYGPKKWVVEIWDNEKNQKKYSYRLDWLMKEYQFVDEGDIPVAIDIDKSANKIAIAGTIGVYVLNAKWNPTSVNSDEPNEPQKLFQTEYRKGILGIKNYETTASSIIITINDLQGKVVFSQQILSPNSQIEIPLDLLNGVYILQIQDGNQTFSKKFLVVE
jgi:WD40 repeat protein